MKKTRVFGGKDDKRFWSDKPLQENHPEYKYTPNGICKQCGKKHKRQSEFCSSECYYKYCDD